MKEEPSGVSPESTIPLRWRYWQEMKETDWEACKPHLVEGVHGECAGDGLA